MKSDAPDHPVSAWEETVVLPTYAPPPPDPNPMFLERRVNQGASGRVYPTPFTDRLSSERGDKPYRAVFLENDYLRLMILPEIGGRIHIGMDKTNDYNFFYRQHVVKPALIGLFGSWIAGGLEFNWPLHHRPSTFMPVHHTLEEHADGGRTVWLSDHEPIDRTKGMVGVRLYPGKAFIEFNVQLYNRTPFPQTFLWWMNVGVHVNDQYQIVFPPDVTSVTDHSKRAMTHFPITRGVYYGVEYSDGVDISWYKNIPVSSSYFVTESRYDFFGGYDHGREAGVIHVANHHISPGKKMFTWGTSESAKAWQRNLTDEDGPYIELMAGAYTDNQPDFSWVQPYETKTFSQYWYPVQKIGPAKNANRRVAVNLEADGRRARMGVCSTETFRHATVSLSVGEHAAIERTVDLVPGAPFIEEVELPDGVAQTDLLLRVRAESGHELIRYIPEASGEKPLPESATPPTPPGEIKSTDELYITGVHVEQYRHPTMDPEPYWQAALRIDPDDARSNNALGLAQLRRGDFATAEEHFRRAIQRLIRRNPNPRDGEPYYNLGLTLRYQGRLDKAYNAFYKAIWSYAWQAAGYYALAEIDGQRTDFATALEHLDRSLLTNARHLKARNFKTAVLRRLGRYEAAEACARETIALDPLDFWSRNELLLLTRREGDAAASGGQLEDLSNLMRGDAGLGEVQIHLDIAFDYAGAGLWDEAGDLLTRLVHQRGAETPIHPMVLYATGYFAHRRGEEKEAREFYRQAAEMPPDYCFPVQLEEMEILRHVQEVNPQDARAPYYLGNLLYDKKHYEEAIHNWEQACRLDPDFSIPWRNLGIAQYNVRRDPEQALACYLKAFEKNPLDGRLLSELDQLMKRSGTPPADRLARLEEHLDLVEQRDDLSVERARLHNQLGQPRRALDIVLSRRFHPWEGGEGRVSDQYVNAHMILGRQALEAGNAAEALGHFEAAGNYPENLGEGRHPLAPDANRQYLSGLAAEALGDPKKAQAHFQQAAKPQRNISAMTYHQALALSRLGDAEASRKHLEEMLDVATQQLETTSKAGFDTSVPRFVFSEHDPQKRRRINSTYMIGLAKLGLGHVAEAEQALKETLALDINHLGAQEELQRLVGRRT